MSAFRPTWLLASCCALVGACRGSGPGRAGPADAGLEAGPVPAPARQVVYSYVDERGTIRMAARVEDIPERYRDQVAVTDTGASRSDRLFADRVVVLDLRAAREGKPLNYSVIDLGRLGQREEGPDEPRNPGELGVWAVDRLAEASRGWLGLSPPRRGARVILYAAPWCGFCKKAAAYLRSRGVPFAERDVEADRAAALELSRKLRKAGLEEAGVPVLDIDGSLVIGFDEKEIARRLGGPAQPTR